MKSSLALLMRTSKPFFAVPMRGMRSTPRFNEEDYNKINAFKGDLAGYFEDLMRRRPQSTGGYINLP